METSYECTVTCTVHQLHSIWKCLRMMIKQKWTVAADDDAFLMEIMSDLAKFDKKTTEEIKFTLPFTKMKACFVAAKYLLDGDKLPIEAQPPLLEVFSKMGIELQKLVNMETPPEKVSKLTLIK